MKTNYTIKMFLLSLFITSPLSAQAIIIDGTFKGKIFHTNEYGENKDPDYANFSNSSLIGSDFSGSFWYDIDLAPTNWGTTGQSRSSENTNWFEISFNVDGKTLSADNPTSGLSVFATSELHLIAEPTAFTSLRNYATEYFGFSELTAANGGSFIHNQSAGISFLDSIIPSLSGNGLIQNFTWHDTGGGNSWEDIPGLASYAFSDNDQDNNVLRFVSFAGRISEMTVKPREVSVPEPSVLLLLGLGVITILIRRRKFIF